MTRVTSGSQTVGPFFTIGLSHLFSAAEAELVLTGKLTDGLGEPIPDAFLEFWSPEYEGYGGFRRVATDPEGVFLVTLLPPVSITGQDGKLQLPHYVVLIFMRGLLRHLLTRVYFATGTDCVLDQVPSERRGTLLARPEEDGPHRWNIPMQGEHETVFFAW